ncbi:hypothetical protein [Oceanobacillus caeni]|uniref:Uncharacterized protein n=1 Tax=Oceanobacillus caeni TaxID=405946 RepID=A0ABR5MJI4_9BACI|nr:hypothetical protein [Oceanobacillus caeni]KPH74994.1 hypothetical protein AFL42_09365 [Oceanobacillus caeni]
MNHLVLLYLAAIAAGFSLIGMTTVTSLFTGPVATLIIWIGAITVIVFSLAIIFHGLRTLFNKL